MTRPLKRIRVRGRRSPSRGSCSSRSTVGDLRPLLQQVQNTLSSFTETVNQNLVELRQELREEREARNRVEEELRAERDAHRDQIKALQDAIEAMQRAQKANNMIMFGVPEGPGTPRHQVESLFSPSSSTLTANILEVRRLGRASVSGTASTNPRPRPMLVRFASLDAKHQAFRDSKRLRQEHRITLDDDLTPNQRANRDRLRPQFQELKEKGMRPAWRGDTIKTFGPQGPRPNRVNPTSAPA